MPKQIERIKAWLNKNSDDDNNNNNDPGKAKQLQAAQEKLDKHIKKLTETIINEIKNIAEPGDIKEGLVKIEEVLPLLVKESFSFEKAEKRHAAYLVTLITSRLIEAVNALLDSLVSYAEVNQKIFPLLHEYLDLGLALSHKQPEVKLNTQLRDAFLDRVEIYCRSLGVDSSNFEEEGLDKIYHAKCCMEMAKRFKTSMRVYVAETFKTAQEVTHGNIKPLNQLTNMVCRKGYSSIYLLRGQAKIDKIWNRDLDNFIEALTVIVNKKPSKHIAEYKDWKFMYTVQDIMLDYFKSKINKGEEIDPHMIRGSGSDKLGFCYLLGMDKNGCHIKDSRANFHGLAGLKNLIKLCKQTDYNYPEVIKAMAFVYNKVRVKTGYGPSDILNEIFTQPSKTPSVSDNNNNNINNENDTASVVSAGHENEEADLAVTSHVSVAKHLSWMSVVSLQNAREESAISIRNTPQ